jgi:hypothetical protein
VLNIPEVRVRLLVIVIELVKVFVPAEVVANVAKLVAPVMV